jgi:uridine monophosphate synthetase
MSSSGTLAKGSYSRQAVALAESHEDTVMGFICLRKLSKHPGMIHFTPGVKLKSGQDALGQHYRTVEEVLIKNKSDIIIVGRDITEAPKPKLRSEQYRKKGWEAYVQTIS